MTARLGPALAALALHTVALARGGVTLVQSIPAAGLAVALTIEAVRERRRPQARAVLGALILVAAVAVLLGWVRPGGGRDVTLSVQAVTAGILALVVVLGLAAARMPPAIGASAVLMGAAGGVVSPSTRCTSRVGTGPTTWTPCRR